MKILNPNLIFKRALLPFILVIHFAFGYSQATELAVGTAQTDITPELPVALMGQGYLRIAKTIATPLTANVIAIESRSGNVMLDAAIMVSCDLSFIPDIFISGVRDEVRRKNPRIDANKIILNATHTHTGPVIDNGTRDNPVYPIPEDGVLQVDEYMDFFVERVTGAILDAWKNRSPGSLTWGLSHAVVGYNRRPVYKDGSVLMYGNTNTPDFLNMEGIEDHDVNVLFFWNGKGKLIATAIDLSCPAQEAENTLEVNADYWHPVREKLKQRFGNELCVLGWISAAGDISTRPMYRKAAEERMVRLRNLTQLEEMGRRVVEAVEEAYETVKEEQYTNVKLIHKVEKLTLPTRLVTESEYNHCIAEIEKAEAKISADAKEIETTLATINWNRSVVDRYLSQKTNPTTSEEAEIHVIRLGDIAICTSPFELFTDFGIRIQARSKALQTFNVQLAGGAGSYLATENAVSHKGYGAIIQTSTVTPEGGQILVDRTVSLINDMFTEDNK